MRFTLSILNINANLATKLSEFKKSVELEEFPELVEKELYELLLIYII